jgi:methylase of polypeptide subunit release factors
VVTPDSALAELLDALKAAQYRFVAVTPATHARVLARPAPQLMGLRDIFGWNRFFDEGHLGPELLALLSAADALDVQGGKLRSRVRVASLGDELLLHSAFPTDETDAVFFGPDTYRFARFVEEQLPRLRPADWLVDMGAGSGAGAIAAAKLRQIPRITMVDTNPAALKLASVNAAAAGVTAEALLSNDVPRGADLIIANPPYMIDAANRSYRDGGALFGGAVSLDWAKQAIAGVSPGGAMLLYTGAAWVDGEAPLISELQTLCSRAGAHLEVREVDPDVFGEELDQPQYQRVERIAAVGALIRAPRP